jgi:hypothetical protein
MRWDPAIDVILFSGAALCNNDHRAILQLSDATDRNS